MAASVSKRSSSPEYEYYDRLAEMRRKMPISWIYILGSCILWTFLSWGIYRGIIYGAMYMRFDDSDLDGFCEEDLSDDATDNFSRLQDVAKGDSWHYMNALGLSAKKKPKSTKRKSTGIADPDLFPFPPIVTAVTSNDFLAVQGLVHIVNSEIRPMFEDRAAVKFILYELSLTSSEKEVLTRHCACLVRSLDQKKFPPHVFDWEKHSWKAILIQIVMKEFGSALWLDPSARPDPTQLRQAVDDARRKGYLLWPEKSLTSVVAYTNPPMFTFYKEQRCTHKDSVVIDSTAMMFYATDFTLRGIMTPWLKCVLTENCVAPQHSRFEDCLKGRAPLYTGCHRYDQSALSIVVSRLLVFTENSEKLVPHYRIAERAETIHELFPERPWTRRHREMAIYFVILCAITFIFALLFGPLVLECMGVRFKRRVRGGHV